MTVRAVQEHDVVETLDAVDRLYALRVDAEARTFELAAHLADLHAGEALRSERSGHRVVPGGERAVQMGGVGTPAVAEFVAAELGGRLRMGSWAARHYLADALDVRHRLPLAWAKVCSGEARVGNVRRVAACTRHLSMEAAGFVDRAMVDVLDGSLPWGRFEARLAGKVVAADPAVAADREAESARAQFAKRARSAEDGTAGFYLRSTVGVIARVEATVAFVAEALRAFGDGEDEEQRRVKAMVVLCNPSRAVELLAAFAALRSRTVGDQLAFEDPDAPPGIPERRPQSEPVDALARMDAFARRVGFTPAGLPVWLEPRCATTARDGAHDGGETPVPAFRFDWSALLPPVTLTVHIAADTVTDHHHGETDAALGVGRVARWEGAGPVTHAFLRDQVSPMHRYVVQPVIDLAGMAPVDAYEIPDRHRRAVHLRTPADCFPYSSNLSLDVDVDHTRAHPRTGRADASTTGEQGASRLDNYGPLGRFHHRIKTHGRWVVRQPFEGIYLWRDPHGQVYLVDHTGTTKVTSPGACAGAASRFEPGIDVIASNVVVQVDFTR